MKKKTLAGWLWRKWKQKRDRKVSRLTKRNEPPLDTYDSGRVHVRIWLNWSDGRYFFRADFGTVRGGRLSWRFDRRDLRDLQKAVNWAWHTMDPKHLPKT